MEYCSLLMNIQRSSIHPWIFLSGLYTPGTDPPWQYLGTLKYLGTYQPARNAQITQDPNPMSHREEVQASDQGEIQTSAVHIHSTLFPIINCCHQTQSNPTQTITFHLLSTYFLLLPSPTSLPQSSSRQVLFDRRRTALEREREYWLEFCPCYSGGR